MIDLAGLDSVQVAHSHSRELEVAAHSNVRVHYCGEHHELGRQCVQNCTTSIKKNLDITTDITKLYIF